MKSRGGGEVMNVMISTTVLMLSLIWLILMLYPSPVQSLHASQYHSSWSWLPSDAFHHGETQRYDPITPESPPIYSCLFGYKHKGLPLSPARSTSCLNSPVSASKSSILCAINRSGATPLSTHSIRSSSAR